ncbi:MULTISPECIES: pyruvate dehydrogenase (acetyl-transferring) E1 component subunit alpha [Micrococcus]|uniref:pyruvate dehydrogenase (acetyl-transferring) E1 component subunit alpha n=1 Tax=Micrococcus TaxID=1269 RepID=UPI00076A41E4|nr:pyruvate dehydrogenase (acetyl-transferring) E1 component subunit alpha [Micrococcus luteus]MBU8763883.1 pyruvate dehydrogenase (acetyl-transferring) E1 component subunit alpha [Micrococcus luteus]MCT1870687.1 pyruvate dehydrogenase (acetyl-transferring) E1 component subunit alpha [Micrococcus luteus]MCV7532584.1 pyruvate dehydrogenase (acetyl-transferring) E1 component subunit alpha [Micrococcus luteus]MCV7593299.1 pyruvate dehydrogenase (acetyl-transferring) E1 component subunit alpha [Mic
MTLVDHTRPTGGQSAGSPPPAGPAEAVMLQVLDTEGRRRPQPELDPWIEDVDADALAALYRQMAVVRRLDVEATHLQRQGELALWPPLLGQEAAQVGSAVALRPDDFVFPSYRENGVALLRGVPALDLLRVWRGSTFSSWDPNETRVATQQIIIGAQALHAVGYAMGVQRDQADVATIVYFGDGATSQGDVNEAMVFSASYQSPVVFFCQNNHWAISEPVRLQTRRSIADRPWGFGIPSMRVDGNDVLAVLAATRAAVERAADGGGPTFIEAVTYRMGPHTTADDPTRYRDDAELEAWKARDPLTRVEAHLRTLDVDVDAVLAQAQAEADELAAEVRRALEALEEDGADRLFDEIYAEPHQELERQRREHALYLQQFDDEEAGA